MESAYNGRNYLQSLSEVISPSNKVVLESYHEMNAYGQVTEERYRNGITTMRTFDSRSGRLTDIDTRKGTAVFQNNTYAWKTNGILQRRENNRDSTHVKRESFAYDALNRLERAESYLNGAATASRTLTMQYDRLGNLTGKTSDVTGDTDVVYASGAAALPGRNARIGVTIGTAAYTLVHDAHGQVTHYNLGSTTEKYLAWNARHLPTTVTVGDSLTDTSPVARDEFAYGPGGARYYKKSTWTVEGTAPDPDTYPTEHTFYVGGFKEVIGAADSVQTTQVTDNVLHVRTTPAGGTATTTYEYLHRDHLGSVESVTDAMGAELRVMAYDPFGERRSSGWMGELDEAGRLAIANDASVNTSRGYTGHEHLERTGLIHMNGRVYDPVLGRFLSPDPVVADATYSQSWNAYSYALNSPLSFTDPSGHIVRPSGGRMGGCSPSICMNFDGASPGGGASHGAIGVNTRYREVHDERYVQSTTVISVGTFGNSSGLPSDIISPAGTRSQLERLLNRLSFDSVREVRYTETSYSVLAQQIPPESGITDEPMGTEQLMGHRAGVTYADRYTQLGFARGLVDGVFSVVKGVGKSARFVGRGKGLLGSKELANFNREALIVDTGIALYLGNDSVRREINKQAIDALSNIEVNPYNMGKILGRFGSNILVSPLGIAALIGDSAYATELGIENGTDRIIDEVIERLILGY